MSGQLVTVTLIVAACAAARGTWSPCGLSMVSAINPLAERGRGYQYWLTAIWFIGGATAGGALLGGGAAVAGWLARAWTQPAAALLGCLGCLVAIASDRKVGGFELPLHPRQVNERWLVQYRRWLYAAGFGFQIGTGFATYIMTAATYLVALLAVLTGSAYWAMAAGLTFGLVRGSAVLLSSRCRRPESLHALHRTLDRFEPASRHAMVAVEVVAAVLLAAAAGGSGRPALTGAAVATALACVLIAISARRSAPSRPRAFRPPLAGRRFTERRVAGRRPEPQTTAKTG